MFYVEPVKLIVTVWLYPGNSEAGHTEALTGVARGFLSAEYRGIRLTAGVADALNRNDVDVVFRREVIPAGAGAWRGAADSVTVELAMALRPSRSTPMPLF